MSTLLDNFFAPSYIGLGITLLLVLTIPLFLHFIIFPSRGYVQLPSILLLGPSGAGKTALLTLFERGTPAATHTTQHACAVEIELPLSVVPTPTPASNRFRSSAHDPTSSTVKKFLLVDAPGHGKLRPDALAAVTATRELRGVVFVVDASALAAGDAGGGGELRRAAEFLHDVLLALQKQSMAKQAGRGRGRERDFGVLIAANKMDLFTAVPVSTVQGVLEREVGKVRASRERGLLDSGVGMGEDLSKADEDEWLGEMGSKEFKFAQLQEFGIAIEAFGGNVFGEHGSDVTKWWQWVGERL